MSRDPVDPHCMRTAVGRWAGLGPYYAMFPTSFAFQVVDAFAPPEGAVLDPFAGRASSIYAAAVTGRTGYGIEINPVGWLYGTVKLKPAPPARVLRRLEAIGGMSRFYGSRSLRRLPEFFHACYSPSVLRFLLAARGSLSWRTSCVDATLMALILVYLHGKRGQALSNQMRQGKAMSPPYSLKWWRDKGLDPPEIDPVPFLRQRIEWRYAKGVPPAQNARVILGDSVHVLRRLASRSKAGEMQPFDLLFTSPPYWGVTNYHYDQWLRLWMLGGHAQPTAQAGRARGRFCSRPTYRALLESVFRRCAPLLSAGATVYVRTDARPYTYDTTLAVLRAAFPEKCLDVSPRPFGSTTQTMLYGDRTSKPGEVDIVLSPPTRGSA